MLVVFEEGHRERLVETVKVEALIPETHTYTAIGYTFGISTGTPYRVMVPKVAGSSPVGLPSWRFLFFTRVSLPLTPLAYGRAWRGGGRYAAVIIPSEI